VVLLLFVVVPLLLFAVLFPLPFWDPFPFFLLPFELLVLEELDAAVIDPLKKSVAPFDKSINADNEFKSPTVLSVTSCVMFI